MGTKAFYNPLNPEESEMPEEPLSEHATTFGMSPEKAGLLRKDLASLAEVAEVILDKWTDEDSAAREQAVYRLFEFQSWVGLGATQKAPEPKQETPS